MKYFIFFLATMLFILQSCSIQKRHYLPGYHIEWNSQRTQKESTPAHADLNSLVLPKSDIGTAETANEQILQPDIANRTPNKDFTHTQLPSEHKTNYSESIKSKSPIAQSAIKMEEVVTKHSKFAEVLKPSFNAAYGHFAPNEEAPHTPAFSILSFIFGVLFFVTLFSTSLWAIVGILFPILAIVFGAVGISKTRRDGQLKGKGFAIAGLVLGIIGLLMIVSLFLLLSLAFPL